MAPITWGSIFVLIASLEWWVRWQRGLEAQERSLGFALLESLDVIEEGTGVMK